MKAAAMDRGTTILLSDGPAILLLAAEACGFKPRGEEIKGMRVARSLDTRNFATLYYRYYSKFAQLRLHNKHVLTRAAVRGALRRD